MFRILIIEDNLKLVQLLEDYIQRYDFETFAVKNFESVLEDFKRFSPHIVLIDINLPKFDGYYWCRQIRKHSTCPILFISARDGKMEQVMAMENGADDFITKPFDYDIVLAKINSQLRRAYGSYASNQVGGTLTLDGLSLDVGRLLLQHDSDKVDLSHTEVKVLYELMSQSENVVSREQLLEKIWDDEAFVDDNTLNVYMTRVRKKLSKLNIQEALVTVRGQGYRLIPNWGNRRNKK
ncbi:response regulator transcription factor [Metabacillus arenae]|uniref:Response regulator transcription factor n=1 Tax=Metabacillus arenae TaxID=2771434 RepID=A0A926NLE2_9BACI|nr:response regulator transcription factor [Metabacillus arenae]MBD1383215.1 response regulator transcription factor [Metabacillus arenae]